MSVDDIGAAFAVVYRARSAIRDVGKVLGLSEDVVGALARTTWGWSSEAIPEERVRQLGLDPNDPTLALALRLADELTGFPPCAAGARAGHGSRQPADIRRLEHH